MNSGRRSEAELQRTREVIARFVLAGYSIAHICEATRLSSRSVDRHISAIRAGWLDRAKNLDEVRGELVGHYQAILIEATRGAAAKRGTTMEIAQQKLRIDAGEKLARLLGLEVKKVELSGSVDTGSEEAELPPGELAKRLRTWADDIEAEDGV